MSCVGGGWISDFSTLTVRFSSTCDDGTVVLGREEGGAGSISIFLGEGGREVGGRVGGGGGFGSLEVGGGVL